MEKQRIAAALRACDWSNVPIGNKAIVLAACEELERAAAAPEQPAICELEILQVGSVRLTEFDGLPAASKLPAGVHKLYAKVDESELSRLRDALSDIARKASESRTTTRRLTWIEGRAQSALEGKSWARHVFMMPDPRNSKPKAERLSLEVAELRQQLAEANARLEKHVPLYEAVNRAAGELPEGWSICLNVERFGGGVELFDQGGNQVEDFPTDNERLDYTVNDAVDAALAATAQPAEVKS